jgi:hypothetical protein
MAIVATVIPALSRDEEYYDVMILSSETESYDTGQADDHRDADWDEPPPRPRRRQGVKLPTVKLKKKKRERKDWCARIMRQLEIRCTRDFVQPLCATRRGNV